MTSGRYEKCAFSPRALGSVSPGCNEIRGRHRVQWTHQLPVTPPPHHRISTQPHSHLTQSYSTVLWSHSHIFPVFWSHSHMVTQSYGAKVMLLQCQFVTLSSHTVSSYIVISNSHLHTQSSSQSSS